MMYNSKATYRWLADGTKVGVKDAAGTSGHEYIGSLIYKRVNGELQLESTGFGGGRIMVAETDDGSGNMVMNYTPNYFITDHLGSTRAVVKLNNDSREILERNDYLPFGGRWEVSGAAITDNRFRFSGKEDQTIGDLPYQDFGARFYGGKLPIWTTIDPLAEISRRWTPYNYAYNNPLRYIDPDGRLAGDFLDEKGRLLGSDGKTDGKLYVVKTTESSFGEGKSKVDGAGLSKNDAKATADFITTNSGNTKAFDANSMAYDNSIEIEGSATNRQAMVTEVSRDNGHGGTADANNREYGGSMRDGTFVPATPGDVSSPLADKSASITLPGGASTAHSHPSGSVTISNSSTGVTTNGAASTISMGGTTVTTRSFNQHPSPTDRQTAGSNTHYVFGMKEGTVYIYNSGGVQATLPKVRFVTPKR